MTPHVTTINLEDRTQTPGFGCGMTAEERRQHAQEAEALRLRTRPRLKRLQQEAYDGLMEKIAGSPSLSATP